MGYGPGMWSSLDWGGVMAGDLRFPLTDESLPGDSRAFGTLAAQSPRAVLDAVPESRRPQPLGDGPQFAISNSFGFGGHNAVVAFRSV